MVYEDDENKLQLQEYNAMKRAARSPKKVSKCLQWSTMNPYI